MWQKKKGCQANASKDNDSNIWVNACVKFYILCVLKSMYWLVYVQACKMTAKHEPYPSLSGWGNTNKSSSYDLWPVTSDRQGCIHLTSCHGVIVIIVMAMLSCCVCSKMLLLLIWWPHWSHWYHPYSVDRQTHTRLVMGFSWMVFLVIYTSSGVRGIYRGHHKYLPRGWNLHSRSFGTEFRW